MPSDNADIVHSQSIGIGGPANNVNVVNDVDGRLRISGSIQLNRVPGPRVAPVNDAQAHNSCTSCQTIAVALQIDLTSRNAGYVAPQNVAIATNYQCNYCTTAAVALQYVIPVDDPNQVPDSVMDLIRTMDAEMKTIDSTQGETLDQAVQGIDMVIAEFTDLAQFLSDQRQVQTN